MAPVGLWIASISLALVAGSIAVFHIGEMTTSQPEPIILVDGRPATEEERARIEEQNGQIIIGAIRSLLLKDDSVLEGLVEKFTDEKEPKQVEIIYRSRVTEEISEWMFWIGVPLGVVSTVFGCVLRLSGDKRIRIYFCMWPIAAIWFTIQAVAAMGAAFSLG